MLVYSIIMLFLFVVMVFFLYIHEQLKYKKNKLKKKANMKMDFKEFTLFRYILSTYVVHCS